MKFQKKVFKKNSFMKYEKFDDKEYILFNPNKDEIYLLNSIASFLWGNCNGKQSVNDIILLLIKKCNIERENEKKINNIFQDCNETFKFMLNKRFIVSTTHSNHRQDLGEACEES